MGTSQQKAWSSLSSSGVPDSARPLIASMQKSKVCATCPHGVRKTLSKVNRKAHPALLEREFQELLTHSFHNSAVPLIGPVFLLHEVFQRVIFLANHILQGQEGTYRTTWGGRAHVLQMWAAGGHCIPVQLQEEQEL